MIHIIGYLIEIAISYSKLVLEFEKQFCDTGSSSSARYFNGSFAHVFYNLMQGINNCFSRNLVRCHSVREEYAPSFNMYLSSCEP